MKKHPPHFPSRLLWALPFTLLVSTTALRADVKPNSLFSDGTVLQQGMEIPVWGTADTGEKVTVNFAGQSVSTTAKNGKWMLRLNPLTASAESATMTVTGKNTVTINNVLVGEVWVCSGQSNMERRLGPSGGQPPIDNWQQEVAEADYPTIRQFGFARAPNEVPPVDVNGQWMACSPQTAAQFCAVGYFFARDLSKKLNIPIGLIYSTWGGTPAEEWTSRAALESDPELSAFIATLDKAKQEFSGKLAAYQQAEPAALAKWQADVDLAKSEQKPAPKKPSPPVDPTKSNKFATTLYNGMIVPLQPYAIRGVIWYQGGSNSGRGKQYRTLFPALIADWRKAWGEGDFPFLFVQIAPFANANPKNPANDPEVREAQFLTLQKSPNTAMAVLTDAGDPGNIHPPHKQAVGARLALAAEALAYGEKIEYSGPLFESMTIAGNQAKLKFTHTGGGLVAKDGDLKGFTIAGADKNFVPAKAEIQGDAIIVSIDQVSQPTAVRYGWAKAPDVNLFNKEGLPASPFRTDTD